jgi:hypothetical protein
LVRKELLAILKDPRSRIALIGPPILQCLIFGYAATYDLNHVPYAALDQDRINGLIPITGSFAALVRTNQLIQAQKAQAEQAAPGAKTGSSGWRLFSRPTGCTRGTANYLSPRIVS